MKDLISVIVPIHNCEKTIERCLLSITKQSYINLEILLIENNSTDNSLAICKQWAKKDSRIQVLNSEPGVSNARNKGLENMTGEYYAFVDSDDYIDLTMYEKLYKKIIIERNDMCFCKINNFFDDGTIREEKEERLEALLKDKNVSYWYKEGNDGVRRVIWRTLFNRRVYGGLRFDTRIFFGEDRDYLQRCYLHSSKCSLVDEYLYYYYCNFFISDFTTKKYYQNRKIFKSRSILTQNCECFLNRYGFRDLAQEQRYKALISCIEDSIIMEKKYREAIKELYSDFFWIQTNSRRYYRAYKRFHKRMGERIKAFLVRFRLYGLFAIMKRIKRK